MTLTPGKIKNLEALSNDRGVIAAAAMDQRGSLHDALEKEGGHPVGASEMEEFKTEVAEVLTPRASAILLDPEYGIPAAQHRASSCGLLLAYEKTGYDNSQQGRLPDLLPRESAHRLIEKGANAVKVLLYYTPFEKPEINDIKHAFIERIGDECAGADIPFFLEFVGYDPDGRDTKSPEYAKQKPKIVIESMAEFTKPQYRVDVLKVEVPVNMAYVDGTDCFKGPAVYSRDEAADLFRRAASVATKPFIYLSAGVSNAEFTETLHFAAAAGIRFAGVLCGRATWKDGIPVFAKQGKDAFRHWLETQGVQNIEAVNACLQAASPWYSFYGVESPEALNPAAVTRV